MEVEKLKEMVEKKGGQWISRTDGGVTVFYEEDGQRKKLFLTAKGAKNPARVKAFLRKISDIFGFDDAVNYSDVVRTVRKSNKVEKRTVNKESEEKEVDGIVIKEISGIKCIIQKPSYSRIDGIKFQDIFRALDLSSIVPVVLRGEKGIGKSYTVMVWLHERGIPFFRVDCSEDMMVSDILGSFIVLNGEVYYKFSALGSALYWASQGKEVAVVFEELNVLPPSTMKALNSLFDFKRSLVIPELGRSFGGEKLRLIATINDSSYMGTYEFSDDIKSRMLIVDVSGDGKREELIKYDFGSLTGFEMKIVSLIDELNKTMAEEYKFEYRDIQKFLKIVRFREKQGVNRKEILDEILDYIVSMYSDKGAVRNMIFQKLGV